MTGIEAIVSRILSDAKKEADKIIASAEAEAKAQQLKTQEKVEEIREKNAVLLASKKDLHQDLMCSRKTTLEVQQALRKKQKLVLELLVSAQKNLSELPEAEYFSVLLELIKKHREPKDGLLLLSGRDLSRLPADFNQHLEEIASDGKGSVELSKKAAAISDGFILRYGGIDENCSFSALFAENQEALQDAVLQALRQVH